MSETNERDPDLTKIETSGVYYVINEQTQVIQIINESHCAGDNAQDANVIKKDNEKDGELQRNVNVTIPDVKIIKAAPGDPYTQNYPYNRSCGESPYYSQRQQFSRERPTYSQSVSDGRTDTLYGARRSGGSDTDSFDGSLITDFDDQEIRHLFVRKVYILLTLQLLVSFGFILLCTMVQPLKSYMLENWYLAYVALVGAMSFFCILACCSGLRKTNPVNFIVLALCTICFAYEFGFATLFYKTHIVMLSILLTLIACVCITVFAVQTAWDVTSCGMYLCIASCTVIAFGVMMLIANFFTHIPILEVVYAGLIGVLFSLYLVYDTQQIVGGRRIQLSPTEYILGALQLYVDVLYIFYAVLQIMGRANQNREEE